MLGCFCGAGNASNTLTECSTFERSEVCFHQGFDGSEAWLWKGKTSSIYREVEGVIRLKF